MIAELAFKYNRKIKSDILRNILSRFFFEYNNLEKIIAYGTEDMFHNVNIETTSLCNRKCSYCPVSAYDRGNHMMSIETYKKIILELKKIGFKGDLGYTFFSEPLLDARLFDFVSMAKKEIHGCRIVLYSNGDLLTEEKIRTLISAGIHKFFVTLHNEKKNKFERTYRKLPGSIKIKIVMRDLSQDHILVSRGGLVDVRNKEKKLFCGYPSNDLVIDVFGNAVLCCEDYFGRYSWGNINESSLLSIWNQPRFRKFRRDAFKGKFYLPICRHCSSSYPR